MEKTTTSSTRPTDEVDLSELVQILWNSKVLIVIATAIVTCIAAAYAFLSTPIYETEVQTLPPTAASLANYNIDSSYTNSAASAVQKLNPQDVYKTFLQRLTSDSTRQKFFEDVYLPAHTAKLDEASEQRQWKRLNKELTISVPTKLDEYIATLTLEGSEPKSISEWANTYVDLAITETRKELLENLSSAVESSQKGLETQISALRKIALVTRQDRITRVKGALNIAESVGLETPPPGSPFISISGANANDIDAFANGNMMYLQGGKALRAELDELSSRTNDDAYIRELPELLKQQELLKNIDLSPEKLQVAIVDRAAIVPEEPIKPNKPLVLLLGIILGGILGIFIALIRTLFQKK